MRNWAVAFVVLLMLAGCAGSINSPTAVAPLAPGFDPSRATIGAVTGEAGPGVEMIPEEAARIAHRVEAVIGKNSPGRLVQPDRPPVPGQVDVKLLFTQSTKGVHLLVLCWLASVKSILPPP